MGNELHSILDFWQNKTIDDLHGGFFGQIDNDNKIITEAPKGSVLNSRACMELIKRIKIEIPIHN